jgi:hypothetical protein
MLEPMDRWDRPPEFAHDGAPPPVRSTPVFQERQFFFEAGKTPLLSRDTLISLVQTLRNGNRAGPTIRDDYQTTIRDEYQTYLAARWLVESFRDDLYTSVIGDRAFRQ